MESQRAAGGGGQGTREGWGGGTPGPCRGEVTLQGHVTAGTLPGATWVLTQTQRRAL